MRKLTLAAIILAAAGTAAASEGDDVTYTLNVSNAGPDPAVNVVLTDNLPDGVVYNDAASSTECDETSSGVVTCSLGDLASGGIAEVTIVVNAPTAGLLTNTASVTSNTNDPNAANNSDDEETTVESSTPPTEIIIDNLDAEFSTVGSWSTGTWGSPYDGSLVYDRLRAAGSQATFMPNIPSSGQYELFVWGVACPNYCATNAPFTVNHAGDPTTIPVDQSDTSLFGDWISLGVFTFEAGTSGSIVLTDDADGRVIADAVRLVPQ